MNDVTKIQNMYTNKEDHLSIINRDGVNQFTQLVRYVFYAVFFVFSVYISFHGHSDQFKNVMIEKSARISFDEIPTNPLIINIIGGMTDFFREYLNANLAFLIAVLMYLCYELVVISSFNRVVVSPVQITRLSSAQPRQGATMKESFAKSVPIHQGLAFRGRLEYLSKWDVGTVSVNLGFGQEYAIFGPDVIAHFSNTRWLRPGRELRGLLVRTQTGIKIISLNQGGAA